MPRSFRLESMAIRPQSFEADFSMTKESNNVPQPLINNVQVVEDEVLISSIRQFFPETWLWSIETSE